MASIFRPLVVTPLIVLSPLVAIGAQDNVARPSIALTTPAEAPKPASTQPVPRGYPYPVSLRTWGQRAGLSLLLAPPPAVVHFRPPTITKRPPPWPTAAITAQSGVEGSRLGTTLIPVFTGDVQLVPGDWPNPDGPIYPSSLRTWTQSGRLPLLGSVPPVQIDQPNPRGYLYPSSLRTWLQEPNPGLLFVTPANPLRPFDWPNPRGYVYPSDLRTWTQNPLTLKSQDVFFGPPGLTPHYDWPNPLRPLYPISLRTVALDRTIVLANAPSLRPLDWPNPRGYAYPTSLRTWTHSLSRSILSATALRPFDWPNPPPAGRAIDLRTIAGTIPQPIYDLITTTLPIGVNIDLRVTLATDGLQLKVCLEKDLDLSVTTICTIELKVP